jgi:hypothetical protein|tara:strand:- start:5651 stop:6073 length:423 start_codon:yes stop_codon:yes gene_type:complete
VFSVPAVLVATNKTVSKLLRKVLSTFATDGDENDDDVKNLAKLLLFPPPGPTRFCLHGFDEEEDWEEVEVQQKHVVVVKVALLLIVFYWIIPTTERASEKKNGNRRAKTQKNSLFLSLREPFFERANYFRSQEWCCVHIF